MARKQPADKVRLGSREGFCCEASHADLNAEARAQRVSGERAVARDRRRSWAWGLAIVAVALPLWAARGSAKPLLAKIATIEANETSAGPHPDVTLTADEVNAYWASSAAKLPKGVSDLKMTSDPGTISGTALVNFDQLESQSSSMGSMIASALFSGTHKIGARAHVDSGQAPAARLTVDQVTLDDQVIPNMLVDVAINQFIKPKHPEIGRTFQVELPKNVKSVSVEHNQVTLHY